MYECISCNSNCKTCKLNNLDYCISCMNETLKAYNGTCCADECNGCLQDNSSACITCKYLFYWLIY